MPPALDYQTIMSPMTLHEESGIRWFELHEILTNGASIKASPRYSIIFINCWVVEKPSFRRRLRDG